MSTVATSYRIGPADHGRAVTADEYRHLEVKPGYQCELARGVLEVTYIPAEAHALLVHLFYKLLGRYDDAHPGLIFLFGGSNEFHFWLPELLSGRNPDVAVALRGSERDNLGHTMASLAIEIVSPGKEARVRDYVAKREEYLLYGLKEYWIVDRFTRKVTVLTRENDSWVERVFDRDDQSAEGRILPGFTVKVAELWTTAEQGRENPEIDENS
jgi:Uma2 family endonuclease